MVSFLEIAILFSSQNQYGDLGRVSSSNPKRLDLYILFSGIEAFLTRIHFRSRGTTPLIKPRPSQHLSVVSAGHGASVIHCCASCTNTLNYMMLVSACMKLGAASPLFSLQVLAAVEWSIREINGEQGMPVISALPTLSRQQTPLAGENG